MRPYYDDGKGIVIYHGDCREVLPSLQQCMVGTPDPGARLELSAAQCCITSPPYWGGVRDYGNESQLGLERDPAGYCANLVYVFSQINSVLSSSGFCCLNLGDIFAASGKGGGGLAGTRGSWDTVRERKGFRMPPAGYKQKDLTLVPFMVANALRRDGWYLRQTIIWSKTVATEPKRIDRPSCSHEYVFMLSKSETYCARDPGADWWGQSVWRVPSHSSADHPATMPLELATRCVSMCGPDATILDPFCGSGTTLRAAKDLGCSAIGIETEERFCELSARRLEQGVLNFEAQS